VSLPPERRRKLQELGLRALVKRRFGADVAASARAVHFAAGAAVVGGQRGGGRLAAVFADSSTALGSAIDTAHREGVDHLYFFAELNTRAVARRAPEFTVTTTVVSPDGEFEALAPEHAERTRPVPAGLEEASGRMSASGLDVVWEDGALIGEWLGLEVARANFDGEAPGGVAFDVGVGKHDREGNRMLYPRGPTDELIAHAVATVAELRRPEAGTHPASQLVPERWLRAVVCRHPELVGLDTLRPAPPPEARTDLRQRGVAPAWGLGPGDQPFAVVCSVGGDPDLVPQAADVRLHAPGWLDLPSSATAGPEAWQLVIAVPEGDDHPLTHRLVGLLRCPATIVTVPRGWRSLDA